MRFAEEKENSLHEGRHHELENELLVQGARIGNPVVFQEFIVQGDHAVFVSFTHKSQRFSCFQSSTEFCTIPLSGSLRGICSRAELLARKGLRKVCRCQKRL